MTERTISCSDGLQIALKHWKPQGRPNTKRVICLHGFLDNCESFHVMGPALAKAGYEVIAMDFPGHGLSGHKPIVGPPQVFAESAFYVKELVEELEWTSFSLIGHSMGAGVAGLYAAMFPEEVEKLVLLEGVGPRSLPATSIAQQVRAHVDKRRAVYHEHGQEENKLPPPRCYPSLDAAIRARQRTARLAPGEQYLSRRAATLIVKRSTVSAADQVGQPKEGVMFRHDPRLQWPSIQYFTPEQVEAVNQDISCPVCLLTGEDGLPMKKLLERTLQVLKPQVYETLPGSHHFHADPDTADEVSDKVLEFFKMPSLGGEGKMA